MDFQEVKKLYRVLDLYSFDHEPTKQTRDTSLNANWCSFYGKQYGGSQAKGRIGAVEAGLHHSHSNAESLTY